MRRAVAVLFLVGVAGLVLGDEVVLRSGARITGEIVSENAREVVLRTEMGEIRFDRSLVKEIRRGPGSGEPAGGEEGPLAGIPAWHLKGVSVSALPAATDRLAVVAMRKGGVSAVDPATGQVVWHNGEPGREVTGLAADAGGVYAGTAEGLVVRFHPRTGRTQWKARIEGPVSGAPLLHRHEVYVFGAGRGLFGIRGADGHVRGRLPLEMTPDTPLARVGSRILVADRKGKILIISDDGRRLLGVVASPLPFAGRRLNPSGGLLALGGGKELVIFDPGRGKVLRRHPVPRLDGHLLGADPARAYALVGGRLTALDLGSGRAAFTAEIPGQVRLLTVADRSLLVTTASGDLCSLRRADGRLRWRLSLGSAALAPPLVVGGSIVVLSEDGVLRGVREGAPPAAPPPAPKPATPAPETPTSPSAPPPPRPVMDPVVHSPHGFRLTVPEGWVISTDITRGAVRLGLRPRSEHPRFLRPGMSDRERLRLEITCYLAVMLSSAELGPPQAQGEMYLREEATAARQGGYGLADPAVEKVVIRGRVWTAVRVSQVHPGPGKRVAYEKRVLVRPLGKRWLAWIELKTPPEYLEVTEEDLRKAAASFAAEDPADYAPPDEVVAAEKVIDALNRGDPRSALPWLAGSPARRVSEGGVERVPGHLSLVTRASEPARGFRLVRVRVDSPEGTSYRNLLLDRVRGRWRVVDWTGLVK